MRGRIQVETDDIFQLLGEARIVAQLERMHAMRLKPCARQMRRTLASLMPTAAAMVRVDQCVRLDGFCCVVFSITSRLIAAEIAGVRPGRGASCCKPAAPSARNRDRHRAAVRGTTPSRSAISRSV